MFAERDLRVFSIWSRVLFIRSGTSSFVKPVVGIGGRTVRHQLMIYALEKE